jgi:dUTP pyrophosphatase
MTKVTVAVKRLPHAAGLPLPTSATKLAAGVDLLAALNEDLTLNPGDRQIIPTGIAIALPSGFEAQVRPRSGLAANYGITLVNSPGTIDADYRGEIGAILINHGSKPFVIERGMRIAQLIVSPLTNFSWFEQDELSDTTRSTGGFGSTGMKK